MHTIMNPGLIQKSCVGDSIKKADVGVMDGVVWIGRQSTVLLQNVIWPATKSVFYQIGAFFKQFSEFLISPAGVSTVLLTAAIGLGSTLVALAKSKKLQDQTATRICLNVLAGGTFVLGGAILATGVLISVV